jgi:hypothetical protein
MAQFKAFAPGVQVNGETVLSVVDGMGAFEAMARNILAGNGIQDPKPGQWYPQQAWLDAFQQIAEKVGLQVLWKIGTRIPENAKWPPDVNTVDKALASIDVAYHMNHRGGEIGHYQFDKTGDRTGVMVCRNPYPDEFDRGIVEAVVRKFKPQDSTAMVVRHDDTKPCRKKGGDSCTYVIKW